ncbi:MAG: hypothetical protein GWP61_25985 [Chloroflexi bacterium]|jgi:hypothetical protein|nr:hypothetical protein [Chloroflexota bacterium]
MNNNFPHGYALIIGVDANQLPELNIPLVAKDVTAFHRVLLDPQLCGYEPGNVKLLTGEQATNGNILLALQWLEEKVQADPQATAVIYFAGHGLRDLMTGQYYLIPYDVQSLRFLRTYAIKAETITAVLSRLHSRSLLLLLDCCHAQSLDFGEESILAAEAFPTNLPEVNTLPIFVPGSQAAGLAAGVGQAILLSSTGAESSFARDDHEMSIFAYHLIEALAGDIHQDESGTVIQVSDILGWVSSRVLETAASMNLSQTPIACASGDFPVGLLFGGQGLAAERAESAPAQPPPPPDKAIVTGEFAGEGHAGIGADDGLEFYESGPEPDSLELMPAPVDTREGAFTSRGIEEVSKGLENFLPPEPTRQSRRFEAAMPNTVQAGVTTEVLVMVPQASGPGLSKYLPLETEAGDVIDVEDVEQREVQIEFTEPGKPILAYVHIQASKRDFEIEESFRGILIYPDRDGDYESFLLTPLRATSRAPVTVKLYADKERTYSLSTIRLSVAIASEREESQKFLARNDLSRTVGYAAATGNVTINVVEGDQISATISDSSGVALGRDAQASVRSQTTTSGSDLAPLFTPLMVLVVQEAPRGVQVQAIGLVQSLQMEISQAMGADDNKIAGWIQDLADTVPTAVETIVNLFTNPPISGTTGGATQFVLGRISRPA